MQAQLLLQQQAVMHAMGMCLLRRVLMLNIMLCVVDWYKALEDHLLHDGMSF
jgi:hypothetical protein